MTNEHFEDFVGSLTPEQLDSLREALLKKDDEKHEEPAEPVETVGEDFTVNRSAAKNGKTPVQA